MSYRVFMSKKVLKFIEKQKNTDSIKERIKKLKDFGSGKKLDLDIKSMKGSWKGYYRLRIGDLRFIFKIVDNKIVFIETADSRGSVYS